MTLLEEYKRAIEQCTGVQAELLDGETVEECIARARAILAFRQNMEKERAAQSHKSTSEQFAEWTAARYGAEESQDARTEALAEIEEEARVAGGGYPAVRDGQADTSNMPDGRSTAEQFAEWLDKKTAFNPFKGSW